MSSNLWSRVKSSTTKIHDIVSNKEHDGDTPETTVIHKALVKYYDEQDLPYPEWLGQPVKSKEKSNKGAYSQQQDSLHGTTTRFGRMNFNSDRSAPNPIQNITSTSEGSHNNDPGTRSAFRSNSSTFRDLYNSGGAEQGNAKAVQGDRMKERLRRNNYRNNFTG